MEEDIEPYHVDQDFWTPVGESALPQNAVKTIAESLVRAEQPLVVTGYSGRNHGTVDELVKLADTVKGLRVLDTGGSDMCFPANHPAWLGLRYGVENAIKAADVILVIDCDVPWINTQCEPKKGAKIYHLDADPLKQQMPVFYIDALARYKVSSGLAVAQLTNYIHGTEALNSVVNSQAFEDNWTKLQESYKQRIETIKGLAKPNNDGSYNCSFLMNRVRALCPEDTIWAIEAVTSTLFVADQIQATYPGSWINCGGGGLGWSGGGALGIKLATDASGEKKFVCQIVGDGTYLFSVPGSVYWISERYKIPVLTVVLNNKGWNAPRRSLELVHPHGEGSKVSNEELNISFAPTPDYAGIAKAASGGKIWAGRTSKADELDGLLKEAISCVVGGTSAVFEAQLEGPQGKYTAEEDSSSSKR